MKYLIFGLSLLISTNLYSAGPPIVIMETTEGTIEVELNPEKAPVTVENFLKYVKEGHYDGLIFHRVINNFVIQGGGLTPDMIERPTHGPIICESANGLSNDRGTIAMARESAPHTATSQFYINNKDNRGLNYRDGSDRGMGYAVFGKVVAGLDVVDKIRGVATTTVGEYEDVPVAPIIIRSARLKTP